MFASPSGVCCLSFLSPHSSTALPQQQQQQDQQQQQQQQQQQHPAPGSSPTPPPQPAAAAAAAAAGYWSVSPLVVFLCSLQQEQRELSIGGAKHGGWGWCCCKNIETSHSLPRRYCSNASAPSLSLPLGVSPVSGSSSSCCCCRNCSNCSRRSSSSSSSSSSPFDSNPKQPCV